jgi:hypothetical protein
VGVSTSRASAGAPCAVSNGIRAFQRSLPSSRTRSQRTRWTLHRQTRGCGHRGSGAAGNLSERGREGGRCRRCRAWPSWAGTACRSRRWSRNPQSPDSRLRRLRGGPIPRTRRPRGRARDCGEDPGGGEVTDEASAVGGVQYGGAGIARRMRPRPERRAEPERVSTAFIVAGCEAGCGETQSWIQGGGAAPVRIAANGAVLPGRGITFWPWRIIFRPSRVRRPCPRLERDAPSARPPPPCVPFLPTPTDAMINRTPPCLRFAAQAAVVTPLSARSPAPAEVEIDANLAQDALQDGRGALNNYPVSISGFGRYRFQGEKLKEWSIGGGARYRADRVLGYALATQPVRAEVVHGGRERGLPAADLESPRRHAPAGQRPERPRQSRPALDVDQSDDVPEGRLLAVHPAAVCALGQLLLPLTGPSGPPSGSRPAHDLGAQRERCREEAPGGRRLRLHARRGPERTDGAGLPVHGTVVVRGVGMSHHSRRRDAPDARTEEGRCAVGRVVERNVSDPGRDDSGKHEDPPPVRAPGARTDEDAGPDGAADGARRQPCAFRHDVQDTAVRTNHSP